MRRRFLIAALCVLSVGALTGQQALDMTRLGAPPTDSWPTYNGDYTGRRFSTLNQITAANVKALSLAWIYPAPAGGAIKATPLQINGVLYFCMPDHAYAVEARTGRELWHYVWPSKGGNHLASRGLGAYRDTLYFETPDCHLVALNMKDGTLKWSKEICNLEQFYYGSVAPIIIKNHVIAGVSGDDMDGPGYLQAHDPVTGEMQWRWYAVPQKAGDPGSETWPNADMAKHGGGMTWQPVTYDPSLNLLYVTTGNPQPVIAHVNRPGANLFTGSIVALDVDTGKMAWYFQTSPHDTHDWDSTQTAIIYDASIGGQPRKLIAQAARNGHFFVLDRATGKALISTEYVKTNWSTGYDERGQPIPNPEKHPTIAGSLVSPNQAGAANWYPPSLSPLTGLFYLHVSRAYSVYYLYDPSDNPAGWGGTDRGGWAEANLTAIDYTTGKVRWMHPWPSGTPRSGLLTTAGNVLFTSGSGGLEALNATTGAALWHARLPNPITNGPITYELDGQQYVTVAAGSWMVSFVLNR